MIGLKFGGATLGTAELIEKSSQIVVDSYANNERPIVVVSALKGAIPVTKYLRESVQRRLKGEKIPELLRPLKDFHHGIASELGINADFDSDFSSLEDTLAGTGQYSQEAEDSAIIYGERISSKVFSALLRKKGISSLAYNAADVGMLTDANFGNANPLPEAYPLLGKNLAWDDNIGVRVVTGFEGITKDGRYTTLGPNSSDFSIAVICAGIDEYSPENVGEVVIFKDTVMMTADPNIVGKDKAKPISRISYNEVAEAGAYASRVIHPQAIDPTRRRGIAIRVRDFEKPYEDGTLITNESIVSPYVVKLISNQEREHLFTITVFEGRDSPGVLIDMIDIFGAEKTSINMIASSRTLVTVTTNDEQQNGNLEKIAERLSRGYERVQHEVSSYIAVIGDGMQDTPGVAYRINEALARAGINVTVRTQPRGQLTSVYFLAPKDNHTAVKAVHREFFE